MSKCLPVVVVAFNRARSLKRLLGSLNDAIYTVDDVPLIISIDKGDSNQDVLAVAESFVWEHGEKKVVYQETNLKLRRHVLQCGDYALKYGNVIVLEDDLYVSKYFYQYAESALMFTQDNNRIGGISLYKEKNNIVSKFVCPYAILIFIIIITIMIYAIISNDYKLISLGITTTIINLLYIVGYIIEESNNVNIPSKKKSDY